MLLEPARTAFEIVRIMDLQPNGQTGYCVVVPQRDESVLAALGQEIDTLDAGVFKLVDLSRLTAPQMIDELLDLRATTVLLHGFESWSSDELKALDLNRSKLETGAFLLFAMDQATLGRFFEAAPNLRSYIGGNVFEIGGDPSEMTNEEVNARLVELRDHYRMTDEDVVAGVYAGTVRPEPHFAEWLILLGRPVLGKQ